jgi:hypothetical protein
MKDRDLTLVGLTEDNQRLVLVSDSGEEFTLPADARLRAALRGEHARLGQLEITMESSLRPRDIQARIRSGESPEQVAAAAQTTLDKVMGYAVPVLAERAHIADRAQRASVRRTAGEGPARVLADAVAERLRGRNLDPAGVEWDAWRREDGRWTLVADYRSGDSPRHAEFAFDAPGSYVVAEDDEARWLVGEQTAVKGPQPRSTPGPRRLSSVGSGDELLLGEDAIELVSGDADWIATQASDRPDARQRAESEQVAAGGMDASSATAAADPDPAGAGMAQAGPSEAGVPPGGRPVELGSEADEQVAEPAVTEVQPRSRRNRRASVPSWDDIMFGGGKRE